MLQPTDGAFASLAGAWRHQELCIRKRRVARGFRLWNRRPHPRMHPNSKSRPPRRSTTRPLLYRQRIRYPRARPRDARRWRHLRPRVRFPLRRSLGSRYRCRPRRPRGIVGIARCVLQCAIGRVRCSVLRAALGMPITRDVRFRSGVCARLILIADVWVLCIVLFARAEFGPAPPSDESSPQRAARLASRVMRIAAGRHALSPRKPPSWLRNERNSARSTRRRKRIPLQIGKSKSCQECCIECRPRCRTSCRARPSSWFRRRWASRLRSRT